MSTKISAKNTTLENTPEVLQSADGVVAALKGQYGHLTVKDHGYDVVKAALREVKSVRLGVEKSRKALKASALEYGRKVDAEANRVKGMIAEVEDRLAAEKKAADDAALAEREEKMRAEREAVEAEMRAQQEEERKKLESARAAMLKEREEHLAAMAKEREELAARRAEVEREEREQREKREAAERAEREAQKAKERAEREEREKAEAAERERQAKIEAEKREAEAKRLAEERRPDSEKLMAWLHRIGKAIDVDPDFKTRWSEELHASMQAELANTVVGFLGELGG